MFDAKYPSQSIMLQKWIKATCMLAYIGMWFLQVDIRKYQKSGGEKKKEKNYCTSLSQE